MKKYFLFILLAASIQFQAKAQVDIQVNPIALLFEAVQVSADFGIGQNGSIALDAIGIDGDFALFGIGKYYMNPNLGADRFYIGGFLGAIADEGAAIGFLAGYKWVSRQGINFEFALGVGRGGGDIEVVPYGKLTVGYRFSKK